MAEGGEETFLKCTICLRKFVEPKLLPCFHTFCANCLKNFISRNSVGNKFKCPLCRRSISVPDGGVDGFQLNFYIEPQKKQGVKGIECVVCGPKSCSSHRCIECEENFCNDCANAHLKMKVARTHRLLDLKSLDANTKRKILSIKFCPEHNRQELTVVCKQCNKCICIVCKHTQHENHVTKDISSESKEVKDKLEFLFEGRLSEVIMRLENEIAHEDQDENVLACALDDELDDISEHASNLHQVIDKIVRKIKNEAQERYKREIEERKKVRKDLEKDHASVASLRKSVEDVLQVDSDADVVLKGPALCQKLEKLDLNLSRNEKDLTTRLYTPGKIDKEHLQKMVGHFSAEDTGLIIQ